MIVSAILLSVIYIIFKYILAWINFYNQSDKRMPNSLWKYAYDYPVVGIRDISDIDDKSFVRQRRKRNTIVTIMYFVVLLAFVLFLQLIANLLILILT